MLYSHLNGLPAFTFNKHSCVSMGLQKTICQVCFSHTHSVSQLLPSFYCFLTWVSCFLDGRKKRILLAVLIRQEKWHALWRNSFGEKDIVDMTRTRTTYLETLGACHRVSWVWIMAALTFTAAGNGDRLREGYFHCPGHHNGNLLWNGHMGTEEV